MMCRRHRPRHGRRSNAAGAASYREGLLAGALTRLPALLLAGHPPIGAAGTNKYGYGSIWSKHLTDLHGKLLQAEGLGDELRVGVEHPVVDDGVAHERS
jgi:hypothetical protein